MSHRKWREIKQQPSRARSDHLISWCLFSLHFLSDIPFRHGETQYDKLTPFNMYPSLLTAFGRSVKFSLFESYVQLEKRKRHACSSNGNLCYVALPPPPPPPPLSQAVCPFNFFPTNKRACPFVRSPFPSIRIRTWPPDVPHLPAFPCSLSRPQQRSRGPHGPPLYAIDPKVADILRFPIKRMRR